MHPPPSPPAEPATLKEEFQRFLADHFEQPPADADPDPDVRALHRLLRSAFFGGCLVGHTHPMSYLPELVEHVDFPFSPEWKAYIDGTLATRVAAGERP